MNLHRIFSLINAELAQIALDDAAKAVPDDLLRAKPDDWFKRGKAAASAELVVRLNMLYARYTAEALTDGDGVEVAPEAEDEPAPIKLPERQHESTRAMQMTGPDELEQFDGQVIDAKLLARRILEFHSHIESAVRHPDTMTGKQQAAELFERFIMMLRYLGNDLEEEAFAQQPRPVEGIHPAWLRDCLNQLDHELQGKGIPGAVVTVLAEFESTVRGQIFAVENNQGLTMQIPVQPSVSCNWLDDRLNAFVQQFAETQNHNDLRNLCRGLITDTRNEVHRVRKAVIDCEEPYADDSPQAYGVDPDYLLNVIAEYRDHSPEMQVDDLIDCIVKVSNEAKVNNVPTGPLQAKDVG